MDAHGRALAGLAFQLDPAAEILHGVLDNGKAEARSSGLTRMALIDPVEALENAALVLRRDADAGVLHGHDRAVRCAVDGHIHAAALTVILDGVVTEVIDDLRSKPADGRDLPVVSMDADRDLLFRRSAGQRGGRLLGQLFQIDRLRPRPAETGG